MPRVAYVIESMAAGSLRFVQLIAREMHRRGWQITVIYSRRVDTPFDVATLLPRDTCLVEIPWHRKVDLQKDLHAILELRRTFQKVPPDVIHLVSSKAGVAGRVAAWPRFRKRVLYSPQAWSFLARDRWLLTRALFWAVEWAAARLGGVVVACSEGERDLARLLVSKRRRVVIENATDSALQGGATYLPQRIHTSRPQIVGTSGRICSQKDPEFFVEVVRRVHQVAADVQFVWIGDGEMRPVLERARREKLPIDITGWLAPDEVLTYVDRCTLYLQTSGWEGMPFAVLEALSLGVPVIARDVVGNRDIVRHAVTGFVARTPGEAAHSILECLRSPTLHSTLSNAARTEAHTRFSVDRLGNEFESLYDAIRDCE